LLIWYLARGAGVTAFAALSVATAAGAYGARFSSRPDRRLLVQYLHRSAALSGITLLAMHITTLLFDSYAHVGVMGAVVPFASGYRPAAVTIGVTALYLLVAVALTGMLRSRFTQSGKAIWLWRSIHLASYPAWGLTAWHFLVAGTDAHQTWARVALLGGIGIVGTALIARVADSRLVTVRRTAPVGVSR
jgi:sulfoxide reductase heme-binding subunit YedZ